MAVKIVETVEEWNSIYRNELKDKTVGFVPTMGALHKGHISLIERSVKENDITVCSIFVNPTQFNNAGDLKNYPITLDEDKVLLETAKCDYIFLPNKEMIYPDGYRFIMTENSYSRHFEGEHRPGHFDGVLSVVMKLLNIIKCDNAYFGEKDWQQYVLIRDMAAAMFMDVNIIPCTLIREDDGLAFSSRNKNLTPEHREIAPNFYRVISGDNSIPEMKKELTELGFVVDYIEVAEGRVLAAASLGEVRLIDNVQR